MSGKARIAVLVSGGGTNLQAILDAAARGEIPDGEVVLVISDRPGAYALERAQKAGIPAMEISKKACGGHHTRGNSRSRGNGSICGDRHGAGGRRARSTGSRRRIR